MGMLKQLNLDAITSTSDLDLILIPSENGLSEVHGFDVYYGELSLPALDMHFDVEPNTDVLDESLKMQRDVDKPRVNALTTYLSSRRDYALPPLILFVNSLDDIRHHDLKNGVVTEATLKATSQRFIVDGQGRTYTVKNVIDSLHHLQRHGIGFMMFVTNTQSIYDCETVIKQIFADINGKTKKPSTSLSLYFDSSKPFSRLLNEVIEAEITVDGEQVPLSTVLAKQGKIAKGKLWTYKQFSSFFTTLFSETEAELNKKLADQEQYDLLLQLGKRFVLTILNSLPLHELSTEQWQSFHKNALFTKAIFAKGLAHLGQSLIDEASQTGQIEWAKLDKLTDLPINDMADALWQKHNVTTLDDKTVKMVRGSERSVARVLCYQLRVMPSLEV
ncbi:DNA sulfur modification protein DndB [Vibrio mediterranei]|uniref:DGQHR domain-containing protein n=1 Tax=Vibrio mediterranei TaxID=689 RepID=UPI0038CEDAD8